MKIIQNYFPNLTEIQKLQLSQLKELYTFWNNKINVISRKDIENILLHHVLHSLSIAKIINFTNNTSVLDVGTGGGFPGIPLAIMFPDIKFLLIDSIAKKIKVVDSVIADTGLKNVETGKLNVTELYRKFDFVVSRAVMSLPSFYSLVKKNISTENKNSLPNGVLYLKGGEIDDELKQLRTEQKVTNINVFNIHDYFHEEYFETKKLVHLPTVG